MRRIALAGGWLVLLLLAPPLVQAQRAPDVAGLAGFAQRLGLQDVAGFRETVDSIRVQHRLPPRYVTKEDARGHGWHGGGLCAVWPGHVIGGDVFHNFAAALPEAAGRVYREADLDADCHSRGPKRLIFSSDGLIFVTVDHYKSFVPVP